MPVTAVSRGHVSKQVAAVRTGPAAAVPSAESSAKNVPTITDRQSRNLATGQRVRNVPENEFFF